MRVHFVFPRPWGHCYIFEIFLIFFLMYTLVTINFALRTDFIVSHRFWYIMISFSFDGKIYFFFVLISFLFHLSLDIMLVNLREFGCFPMVSLADDVLFYCPAVRKHTPHVCHFSFGFGRSSWQTSERDAVCFLGPFVWRSLSSSSTEWQLLSLSVKWVRCISRDNKSMDPVPDLICYLVSFDWVGFCYCFMFSIFFFFTV